ncbi:MAG TPA: hypothetical protein VFA60_12260 [Terriglobales bacterium]|nr:hypothetical protein [Terriglobales bacterium]
MPAPSATDVISPAFAHTRLTLLPFRFKQWARWALLGIATGEMSSNGGCNFNFPSGGGGSNGGGAGPNPFGKLPHFDPQTLAHVAMWIALLVVSAFALMLVFVYVASVCRFILFESVLERRPELRRGWNRWQPQGRRLFLFHLFMMLVSLAGLAVLAGVPLAAVAGMGALKAPRDHILLLALVGAAAVVLLMVFFFALAIANVFTKDFVVPQMALEDLSVREGWKRLWAQVRSETRGYAGYIGMKILLALGAAIIFGILSVILIFVLAIPAVAVVLIIVAAGAAGATWNVFTIALAATVGLVLLCVMVFLMAMLASPVTVFFPAYSMHFFAGRYRPLAARLTPPPPPIAPEGPEIPPAPQPA